MIKNSVFGISCMLVMLSAHAAIVTEQVEYKSSDGTPLEGFVTYDDAHGKHKPGVLIVSDEMGMSDYTKQKAEALAKLGYMVFGADIYGKGVHPRDTKEANDLLTKYLNDRPLLRSRIKAAYDKLISLKGIEPNKIVAVGYGLGGATVLELARSGVPLVGTVSFHGVLSNPKPEEAKNIKGKVLIMNGAEDPSVTPAQVAAFKDEMKKAGITVEFIDYKGAVHAFSDPKAGNDNSKGAAYNAKADKDSWNKFTRFLKQAFGKNTG